MARTELAIHLSLLNHALAKETKRALTIIFIHTRVRKAKESHWTMRETTIFY